MAYFYQGITLKFLFLTLLFSTSLFAQTYRAEFPTGPVAKLTPGSLCVRPDARRYPEQINYCNRNVGGDLKADVFREYRLEGFRLTPSNRSQYKIDHLIPLCAGGSNSEDNLWPQHSSIFVRTDSLESVGCEKLKDAKIKQADLIKLILAAKKDLSLVSKTLQYLQKL
jgi:hypothetical protein